jgi:hypothetical protein
MADEQLTEVEHDARRVARMLREIGPRQTPYRLARIFVWPEPRALEACRCLVEHGIAVRVGLGRYTLTELGHTRALAWERGEP